MTTIPFDELRDIDDVAHWVNTGRERLDEYLSADSQVSFWTVHELPKKGRRKGICRRVYEARSWLAAIHRDLAIAIGALTRYDEHVQGYRPGSSILKNAAQHVGHQHLLLLDIEDFFESIDTVRVVEDFALLGANPKVADILGRICTLSGLLPNGFLPPGGRASPILSNRACRLMDADLLALAASTGATYTRYADDIAISGDRVPAQGAVEAIVRKHGFAVRREKSRAIVRGQGQFVTGLSVDEQGDHPRPRVPRKLKRRLRLVTHYAAKHGVAGHVAHSRGTARCAEDEYNYVNGLINFVMGVERQRGESLRDQWRDAQRFDEHLAQDEARREEERPEHEDDRDSKLKG